MRLFAAVDPPDDVVAALSVALPPAREDLRWVPAEQWHLTTAFYGDVPEARVGELTDRLERAAKRSRAMSLQLAGAGTFPRQAARARVLWVGVTGEVELLGRLADRCVAAGRRCGLTMEDRPYHPHLTLGRARREPLDLRSTVTALSSFAGRTWTAASLRLVVSTLGATVRHETVVELPLAP